MPKFLQPIDLSKLELLNARIQNLPNASLPSGGAATPGLLAYDSTNNRLVYYNGTTWIIADGTSVSYGSPVASAVADTASDGVAITVARSDHRHAREAWGGAPATTENIGTAAAAGAATTPSRSDHVHAMAAAGAPAGSAPGDAQATGAATTFAASNHVHAREAFATNTIALGTAAAAGAAGTLIRSDATIAAFDATAATTSQGGDAAAAGVVNFAARRDHVHGRENTYWKQPVRAVSTSNISLTGTQTVDGVSLIAGDRILVAGQTTASQNGIYIVAAGAWARGAQSDTSAELSSGSMVPVTEGTAFADTVWTLTTNNPITLNTTSLSFVLTLGLPGSATTTSAVGNATSQGTSVNWARSDHVHGREAFATPAGTEGIGTAAAQGVATTISRSDHVHPMAAAGAPAASAPGNAQVTGVATTFAASDHVHAREAFATPAVVLGTAAAAGAATTLMRSDATIAAFDATAPTTSAEGDAAAAGSVAFAARRDHVHGREAFGGAPGTTEGIGTAAAAGAATTPSRSDHVHAMAAAGAPAASAVGDTVVTGVATTFAASDHKHAREAFGAVTAQTTFGASSGNGAATTIARSDHTHGTPTHIGTDHSGVSISALSVPTGAVAWNAQKITGLADPTAPQDAATKAYVDASRMGLDVKDSVRVASTATVGGTYNATGGTSNRGQFTAMPNTLDGVTLVANDRVLLKDQGTGAQNGIWVVSTLGSGANGVWDRATDADADAEVTSGMFTFVEEGTVNSDSGWVLTTNNPITIGGASGTALVFAQFSGAGQIVAGNGLTKTGNTLDVGGGTGISVAADSIALDTAVAVRKYAASIGDGSTLVYVLTHNLNTQDVIVAVRDNSSPFAFMYPDTEATSVNTVTVRFAVAPTTNQYRVIVHA